MSNERKNLSSRRSTLKAGLALAATPLASGVAQLAAAQERPTTKVHGFETMADIAKAEAEGEFTYYSHDSEPAIAGILEAFNKDFPKIKGKYVRAQTGTLFSRTIAERQAGRYVADVIQFSEITTAMDFQKRGGYQRYVSPETKHYDARYLSNPVGDYFWVGVTFAGIAYNTEKVKAEDAPKEWKDVLKPTWMNGANVKQSNSGMQFVQWWELRKLYGEKFWADFAKNRPRGFDSRAQQFERLAKGDDRICVLAEYAGYLLVKEKGAPVAFVAPADGLPATPAICGMADRAPHPEAARLFMDWQMSPRGQNHQQTSSYLFYGSVRKGMGPMPGGWSLSSFKLLLPDSDMDAFVASRDAFTKEWNGMLGL
ncbi:MAG: extracellular solute-binding protein [Alphaproteobacteria bacterium]|nr:extracellular solute-binding protein [Alphaproteobacteria bacterium]